MARGDVASILGRPTLVLLLIGAAIVVLLEVGSARAPAGESSPAS